METINPLTLDKYNDAGHGWLCVPFALLVDLGLVDSISSWSYESCGNAYLEEDSDAPKFRKAWDDKNPSRPLVIKQNYEKDGIRSFVRSLAPYSQSNLSVA